jgi:hypothetical protein
MRSARRAGPVASRGWSALQRELAKALAVLGEGECQYLILSDQRTWRYVQFAVEAGQSLRAEAVSNNYLLGELADDLGKKLQARFGGRTALNEPGSRELKN